MPDIHRSLKYKDTSLVSWIIPEIVAPPVVVPSDRVTFRGRYIYDTSGRPILPRGAETTVQTASQVSVIDDIAETGATGLRLLLGLNAVNGATPAGFATLLERVRYHGMVAWISFYVWDSQVNGVRDNYLIASALGGGNFYNLGGGSIAQPRTCYLTVWDRPWAKELMDEFKDVVIIDAAQEYKSPTDASSEAGRIEWGNSAIQNIQFFRGRGYTQPLELMANFQGRDLYGIVQQQARIRAADIVTFGGQPQTMFGWQAYWEPDYYKTYQGPLFLGPGQSLTSAQAITQFVAEASYPIQVGFDNYGGDMGAEYVANMIAAHGANVPWLWWDWRNDNLDMPLSRQLSEQQNNPSILLNARNRVLNASDGFSGSLAARANLRALFS